MALFHRAGINTEPPKWADALLPVSVVRQGVVKAAQKRREDIMKMVKGRWISVLFDGVSLQYVKRIMVCLKVDDEIILWALPVMAELVAGHTAQFSENVIKAVYAYLVDLLNAGAVVAMVCADGAKDAQARTPPPPHSTRCVASAYTTPILII
jgi:hypothetical protein